MSTILDALKKSEAQRRDSEAHQGPYLPPTSPRGGAGPLWASALLLAVVVGLGLGWLAWRGGSAEPAVSLSATELAAPGRSTESAEPAPTAGQSAGEAEPDTAPNQSAGGAMPATEVAVAEPAPQPREISVAEPVVEQAAPEPRSLDQAPKELADHPAAGPSGPRIDRPRRRPPVAREARPKRTTADPPPRRQATAPPRRNPRASPAASPPAEVLPVYPSVDRDLRDTLGPLQLNMLMYSGEAERRFALINMQRVAEGGSVGEAEVDSIRQDGVVLSLRGRRFLLAPGN